ncbi:hypothetical protein BKA63DRAFT_585777 [Paraphoma chrysanthemicola]|nr:hypothetical protein BKA63DRAFT_585777 [Paraphoma chrysanthemicola]
MPSLYFIVRFDADRNEKPPFNTTDVSITGVPAALSRDGSRIYHTYTVIDEEAADGPWTYRVAIDIAKARGTDVRINYGTLYENDAFERLKRIPEDIKESDKERKHNHPDYFVKAKVTWQGDACLEVKLRTESFCWYEMVTVEVNDLGQGLEAVDEADRGGDKKRRRRRTEIEQAVGEDMDIFEDEDEEDMDEI